MSLEEFAARLAQLEDPFTDPHSRHAADTWLTQFRDSPAAWGVAKAGVAATAPPHLRAPCAQMLAFKSKRQLAQLPSQDQRIALLEAICATLAATPLGADPPAVRSLAAAAASLIVQTPELSSSLGTLNALLPRETMLEFLTALPGECEDSYERLQAAAAAEAALHLKQRAEVWCADLGDWLWSLTSAVLQQDSAAAQSVEEVVARCGDATAAALTPLIRCFAAWTKWGGLFSMRQTHWEPLLRVAGALAAAGPSAAAAAAVGVEAVSEAIERASAAAQPVLFDICVRLLGIAGQRASVGAAFSPLAHLFSSFAATNAHLAASKTPQGDTLRRGLLVFIDIGRINAEKDEKEDDDGSGSGGAPAIDALGDVLEVILDGGAGEDEGVDGAEPANGLPKLFQAEKIQFAAAAVDALLRRCTVDAVGAEVAVPTGIRAQAEWPLCLCGEVLTAEGLTQRLAEGLQGASGGATLAALDACFFALKASSGCFTEHLPSIGGSMPPWFPQLLGLYAAAAPAAASGPAALLPILHRDLLASFAAIAPAITRAMISAPPDQSRGLINLVLGQAAAAIAASPQTASASTFGSFNGEDDSEEDSLVESAAAAVKALLSSPEEMQTAVLAAGAAPALHSMLAALSEPQRRRDPAVRRAGRALLVAAVHAAHAADPGGAGAAGATLQALCLQPLVAVAAGAQQRHYIELHWALSDALAVLNALESHADVAEGAERPGGAAALADTVATCLSAWPDTMAAAGAAAAGSDASSASLLFRDASQILSSCLHLAPAAVAGSLQPALDAICSSFFLPGGTALHRALCAALEALGAQPACQPPLVSAVRSLLASPAAAPLAAIRGGDAAPDTAAALLTVSTALLRQAAAQWTEIPAPEPVIECVRLSLRLAAANAACNHREASQRAVSALSAALALILDVSSPLHARLLALTREEGRTVMQGVMLCLLSLHSASFLPKIVSLMSDAACAAAAVAGAPPGADSAAVAAAAAATLQDWWSAARQGLEAAGAMPPAAADALLAAWDWGPVVAAAAAAWAESGGGRASGRGAAELRRGVQRAARQLADAIKKT